MKHTMKYKSTLWLVRAAILAISGTLACRRPDATAMSFETAAATRGTLVQHVTASGSLSAMVNVDVGSQVSGKVMSLLVDYNSPVKRGQLVATIDSTLYVATRRQAEGELASARATVILKAQNLERKRMLVPLKAASQFDLDQATAELAQAQATVSIREAAVESARANVDFCRITAPVDGIVIGRTVDVGQTVIAAMTTPVLFTVAQNMERMYINTSVAEADVGMLREGQPVEFTVDAYPEDLFPGKVSQIRRSPTTTQNVVTYETVITVSNPGLKLFPGMTADVSIRVAEREGVVQVPNAALRYTPPANATFETTPPSRIARAERVVYVPSTDGQRLRAVVVRVGVTDGVMTEVVSGLEAGARVVTATASNATAKATGFRPPAPPPQQ